MKIIGQVSLLMLLVNCARPFVKADVEVKEAFSIASPSTMTPTNVMNKSMKLTNFLNET